jgi:antitoxin MazE
MVTAVKRWGNSLGIRIPKAIAQQLNISDGANISINVNNDLIEISKVPQKMTLKDKLQSITPENLHSEVSTGTPVGNEIW